MTKTSQWAGYMASLFSVACLFTVIVFSSPETEHSTWFRIITGSCIALSALSGIVCLASAMFEYARRRMDAASHDPLLSSRKPLLVLAASYSCVTPFIVAVFIGVFYFIMYQIEVKQNHVMLSRQAYGDILEIPFFVLVSTLVSGVVSLFGIRQRGARPILLKAIVGILASLGVGFVVYMLLAMSCIIC